MSSLPISPFIEKLRKKGLAYEKTKNGNTWRITEVNEIECKECDE